MDETSGSSFFVVLLFILRCFIPLAILFGISYLLRRMGLVATESPEPNEEPAEKPADTTQPKKPKKKKVPLPREKPPTKTKTGSSRSRSK